MQQYEFKIKKSSNFTFGGKIGLRILVGVSVLVASLVFAQLVSANNLALGGQKLSQIDDAIAKLAQENNNMSVEIAKAESLTSLSKKAQHMGYVIPSKVNVF